MPYMLDTCICVAYLRGRNEGLLQKLRSYEPSLIKIPAIVMAELMYGAYKSRRVEDNLREIEEFAADFEIIPFDNLEAQAYGQIRTALERKGSETYGIICDMTENSYLDSRRTPPRRLDNITPLPRTILAV